jgi:enoyl-CoA hydratase/carnithine racemase
VETDTVLQQLSQGVLLLTLNRPRQKNAFNTEMWRALREALVAARANDAVRTVVVTGAEGAFTAGQDLGEMSAGTTEGAGGDNGFSAALDELCEFDKPLVAAVNGVGIGFGITLLLHCDYVYIARGARLRAPFITLGVVPEAASSYLFPALLGWRRATDLLFESDFIAAERAVELGLATELCEPAELKGAALARAKHLAAKPLGSLRWTKRLLLDTRRDLVSAARAREDEAFRHRVGSPENIEAVQAFFGKRAPDFSEVPPTDRS